MCFTREGSLLARSHVINNTFSSFIVETVVVNSTCDEQFGVFVLQV